MNDPNPPIEVEQKYHVDDPKSLRSQLMELGAAEQSVQQHVDTYYNHPCRDFAQTHEALRVRRCDDIPLITYKGTKLPGNVKARRELEWRLDPGDDDGSQMETLLTLLGFCKVASVQKTRQNFCLVDDQTEFLITIDQVEKLGWFAEIELIVDASTQNDDAMADDAIELARQQILALAPKLGLHQDQPLSYLKMLLESGEN